MYPFLCGVTVVGAECGMIVDEEVERWGDGEMGRWGTRGPP